MADTIAVHWVPLGIFILIPATFIISYCIAVGLQHVEPGFPYISDTGAKSPESCIFGQLLNMAGALSAFFFYIRYSQIDHHLSNHNNGRLRKANIASLYLGLLSALGMSMVGNFQETNVLTVHLMGAVMAFGVGCVYAWIHVVMSYKTHPHLTSSLYICHLRVVLTIIVSLTFILTFLLDGLAKRRYHGTNPRKWYPSDGGFVYHVISTVSEWLMATCLLLYFLSFASEFKRLRLSVPRVTIVQHGNSGLVTYDDDDVPPLIT